MSLKQKILAEVDALTIAEQIELVKDILDNIAEYQTPQLLELAPEVKAMLDERYQDYLKNPDEGIPWEEALEEIKASR